MGMDLVVPSDEEEWEDWVERRAREKREIALAAVRDDANAVQETKLDGGGRGPGSGQGQENMNGLEAESSKMAQIRSSRRQLDLAVDDVDSGNVHRIVQSISDVSSPLLASHTDHSRNIHRYHRRANAET